jgi:hypothetical protein
MSYERDDAMRQQEATEENERDLRRFHNRLRILVNIDMPEFLTVAPDAKGDDRIWVSFRQNPWRWFIRASDDQAAALWKIIRARETR